MVVDLRLLQVLVFISTSTCIIASPVVRNGGGNSAVNRGQAAYIGFFSIIH